LEFQEFRIPANADDTGDPFAPKALTCLE
jgi:hypothetical protein